MNKFLLLTGVQLQNSLRLDGWRQKGKRGRFVMMGAAYVILAVVLLGYCYLLGAGLGAVGLPGLIPLYAMTVSSLMTLFFTFLKANGMLFGCRDYELLAALPVPTSVVLSSRFAVMYLYNMVFSLGVMAAMGISYIPYGQGPLTWVFWIAGMLLANLIPTTIASMAAGLVAAVSSRFRYSNAVNILLSLVLVFGVLGFSMKMASLDDSQLSAASIAALGDQMAAMLTRVYPPAAWFGRAVQKQSLGAFGLFMGISLGLYLVFALILSVFYQKIQNGLTAHRAAGRYQVGRLNSRSALRALYQKEWKGFLSSPVYVMNMGIGVLMAVAACAVVCFMGPEALLSAVNIPGMERSLARILLFVPVVILPMSNTACVSLSLEGRQLWILQSAPVSLRQIFGAKILVNLTIGLPGAVISSLLLWVRLCPSPADGIAMLLLAVIVVVFISVLGIWINLKFPVYQWENQTQVVKQSASSMCGIFSGLLLGIGLAFVAVKLPDLPLWMIGGVQCAVLAAAAALLWGGLQRVKHL